MKFLALAFVLIFSAQSFAATKCVPGNVLEEQLSPGSNFAYASIVSDGTTLLALGYGYNASGNLSWVTKKSTNSGKTWTQVDRVDTKDSMESIYPTHLTKLASGKYAAIGVFQKEYPFTGGTYQMPLVDLKVRSNVSGVWKDVAVSGMPVLGMATVTGSAVSGSNTMFISEVMDTQTYSARSLAVMGNGKTFQVKDDFSDPSFSVSPQAVSPDGSTGFYVSGLMTSRVTGERKSFLRHCPASKPCVTTSILPLVGELSNTNKVLSLPVLVINPITKTDLLYFGGLTDQQMSNDLTYVLNQKSTTSLSVVNSYRLGLGSTVMNGIVSGSNIYLAANSGDAVGSRNHWMIQKTSNAGKTVTTIDDWAVGSGLAIPLSVTKDSAGNIFSVGVRYDAGYVGSGIIRKSCE